MLAPERQQGHEGCSEPSGCGGGIGLKKRDKRKRQKSASAPVTAAPASTPDYTYGGIVPAECRGKPSGEPDVYEPHGRRLFRESDVSRFWIGKDCLRLTHGPTGISAEGTGDEREALIEAGTILEARLVFVRREKELGVVIPS